MNHCHERNRSKLRKYSYRIVPLARLVRTLRRCHVIERVKEALCRPMKSIQAVGIIGLEAFRV